MSANTPGKRSDGEDGLRLIIGYKVIKAGAEVLLGAVLFAMISVGLADELRDVALSARNHAAAAWSISLAEWLMNAATSRNLHVIALASLLDGAWSGFEGWALHRRYRWSGWLVVAATASLFPFEIVAIARHARAGRIALLLLNVVIVGYLVRAQLRRAPTAART